MIIIAANNVREQNHEQALRTFSVELIAWFIWDGVKCTLPEGQRDVEDYLTAEKYLNANPQVLAELKSKTSPGITREVFNARFGESHYLSYMRIIQDRQRWMGQFYVTLKHEILDF